MTTGRRLSGLTLDELAAIEGRLMSSVDTDARRKPSLCW
jgi:hypothetical protein